MKDKMVIIGNGADWCKHSLIGLTNSSDILLINDNLPIKSNFLKNLGKIYFSYKINRIIKMPFKKVWYVGLIQRIKEFCENNNPYVIIYDHNKWGGEVSFIKSLRKRIPNVKIIYIFTNIVKFTSAEERKYVDKLNDWYDVVFAFDLQDAKKYGFSYSPLIYDPDQSSNNQELKNDEDIAFYIGQAKDRLSGLIEVYHKLIELGVNCDFNIANVSEKDIVFAENIIYNKWISYDEVITKIKNSTCLIDVIQGDSTGLTIKVCEAVCYDKKLITTNKHIIEYPFYDPKYIRVIESPDDIDDAFFNENKDVRYSQDSKKYFSAEMFLERLENELRKKENA